MNTSPLSMEAIALPVLPAPFLTISTATTAHEKASFSRSCSPFPVSNQPSPQVSPVLSSSPASPSLRQPSTVTPLTSPADYSNSSSLPPSSAASPCLAEQRLRSSFAQHNEYQQQMRKRLSEADHPLHLPGPELAQRHQQQLALQLEYYRQLQIMHGQRARDIELLHLQQRQLQQRQHQPVHVVKRVQLAQQMLQMQQLYHAQQIQKIQYLQKLNFLQSQPVQGSNDEAAHASLTQNSKAICEEDIVKLEIDPNTIHIPMRAASRPRLDLHQILGTGAHGHRPTLVGQNRVPELAKIVLPSPEHIKKLRMQRLKQQARMRQAAALAATKMSKSASVPKKVPQPSEPSQPCATSNVIGMDVDPAPAQLTCPEVSDVAIATLPNSSTSPAQALAQDSALVEKTVRSTVWTSSTTSVVPRSKADLQYKRQLRHSMALQQHMIQDHTHRYRIFQAFCLLQRAREAQALDELQIQQRKKLQTLAWVESVRHSKELEIPQ